ncbi:MAG: PHP domain-containing protein, partial [Sciscionella sp.]
MLDGAAKLKDMFAQCGNLDMPAVAITDHGHVNGVYDFYTQAVAAGIKPIPGIEAYLAPVSRFVKERVRWGEAHQRS